MTGLNDVQIVQKLSALGERSSLTERDIEGLKDSNERRKQVNMSVGEKLSSLQNQVSAIDAALRGQAKATEGIHDDMTEIRRETKETANAVAKLTGIVEEINKKSFNWSKLMSGIISPKGMVLSILIITSFTIIMLAQISPEHLPLFFDVVKSKKF